MSLSDEFQAALDDGDRFQALALVNLDHDRLLFFEIAAAAPEGLREGLEAFLLRAVTRTENYDLLKEDEEVLFYDLEGRQVILNLLIIKKARYILVAVVAPGKTYKQPFKRLLKSARSTL